MRPRRVGGGRTSTRPRQESVAAAWGSACADRVVDGLRARATCRPRAWDSPSRPSSRQPARSRARRHRRSRRSRWSGVLTVTVPTAGAVRESTTTSSPVLLVRRAGDTGSGVAAAACWRPGWGGRVRSMVRSRWSTLPKVISTSRRRASMPRTRRPRPRLRRPASVTGSWFVRAVISVPFAVLSRQSRSYRHSRLVGAQNREVHVPPMTRGM